MGESAQADKGAGTARERWVRVDKQTQQLGKKEELVSRRIWWVRFMRVIQLSGEDKEQGKRTKERTQRQIMVLWEWPAVVWGAEELVLWILQS